ncbi:peptidase M28 [Vulcanibacillus modesticaldus]|uniref:Peptidase M28 n=1 Tax=Vulcanibacillus modesticaldus TaxID=337097 RepID=A0A1D2YUM1_9BACI|nr:M42 family metallopeptidase [Vulcanibacillus modesticaldus]OEF99410.1 peptidase M28 [Vulcanibacillus modesticaldus]
MDKRLQLFKELTEAHGAPGFEKPVRDIMRRYISRYTDEIIQDNLGGIFGIKRGNSNGPKVMVAGHMDEVGFMVTRITKEGFIKFQTLGGWWSQVLLAQRVSILTPNGEVEGIIGSLPPHILPDEMRRKPIDIKKMFIDIGAKDKEDAEKIGIRPGQPIVPVTPFRVMANNKRLMAKAWDNRYGCAMAIDLLDSVKDLNLPNTLYAGANVQEEVGLRGAQTSAEMINPDIFFALDAGPAGDMPNAPEEAMGKLGDGVIIRIYDRTYVTHRGMRDYLLDTVESLGVKYQYYVSQGGTDAGRVHLHGKGVPSIVIAIPSRYIHSHASIIDYDDYLAAKETLTTLVKNLDKSTYETILKNV